MHINPEFVDDNTLIYVIINEKIYEVFPCSNNNQYDDYAFGGYIPNTEDINQMKVAVLTDGILHIIEDKK